MAAIATAVVLVLVAIATTFFAVAIAIVVLVTAVATATAALRSHFLLAWLANLNNLNFEVKSLASHWMVNVNLNFNYSVANLNDSTRYHLASLSV